MQSNAAGLIPWRLHFGVWVGIGIGVERDRDKRAWTVKDPFASRAIDADPDTDTDPDPDGDTPILKTSAV
jgi:hypothetical protein